MGGVLTYRHEEGMNYNDILDDLIVGSCPQTAADVDRYGCVEALRFEHCMPLRSWPLVSEVIMFSGLLMLVWAQSSVFRKTLTWPTLT